MRTNRMAVSGTEKRRAACRIRIHPEDREVASIACHFQKGPVPTHTEDQVIASNARKLATVEAIVGYAHFLKGCLYGCQGTLVFLMTVPHGFDNRLVVSLQRRKATCPLGVAIHLIIAFLGHHQRTSDLHFSRQPSVYRNRARHIPHATW